MSDYTEWNKTRIDALATRVLQLERLVLYLNTITCQDKQVQARQDAARAQATEHLYAPLRNDTKAVLDLAAFARRLLNPEDLGHAVSYEVREAAREALGLK